MRVFLVLILISFTLFGKLAESNKTTLSSDTKLFLWEATKDDKRFYLLGTMHLPHPKITFNITPKVKKIIDRVDYVYTEIPLDFISQMVITKAMVRDDNKSLKEILPPKVYKKLKDYLKSINPYMSVESFDRLKIWAIGLGLEGLKYQVKYRDFTPLDKAIYEYAFKNRKFRGGIESLDEQINVFKGFTLEEEIKMLDETLDGYKKYPNLVDELIDIYFLADEKKLEEIYKRGNTLIELDKKLLKKVEERILFSRNKRMAQRVDRIANDKKVYLFAFGAMHFVGKNSIIELLNTKGYRIKRVNFKEVIKDDKRD